MPNYFVDSLFEKDFKIKNETKWNSNEIHLFIISHVERNKLEKKNEII